jgi:hypothetical protein
MRSQVLASALVAVSLLATSSAVAQPSAKKRAPDAKKSEPVLVASAEPLPQLPPAAPAAPASEPAAPPVVKDQPATAAATEPPSAGPGFVLTLSSGLGSLNGKIGEGLGVGAMFLTVDLKLGAYVTSHLGFLAGVQGGYGFMYEGCAGSCTNAFTYQLPIVAQYAFEDRRRGAYVEGGLALLTTYAASTDTKAHPDASPETLAMSAPIDLQLGVGYRIAPRDSKRNDSLDLRFGMDVGQFKSVEYGSVAGEVAGDIASERQAMHFALGLTVGYHFVP